MKVCVLQPDYSTSAVDYQHYDPPRDLSHLMPEAQFDHITLNKLTTYRQLKELKKKTQLRTLKPFVIADDETPKSVKKAEIEAALQQAMKDETLSE